MTDDLIAAENGICPSAATTAAELWARRPFSSRARKALLQIPAPLARLSATGRRNSWDRSNGECGLEAAKYLSTGNRR